MFSKIRTNSYISYAIIIQTIRLCFIPQDYSGAGLICDNTLIGVLTKLCVADQINAYTNVFAYEAWITEKLAGSISSMFAVSTLFGVFFGQCIQFLLNR